MGANAELCSGSLGDFGYANKNGLSDQHVRYLLARGEIEGKIVGKTFVALSLDHKRKRKPKRRTDLT